MRICPEGRYRWRDEGDQVEVRYSTAPGLSKRDVAVDLGVQMITVTLEGKIALTGRLFAKAPAGTTLRLCC